MSALGIVDWGIGGLGFYRALRRRVPDAQILYWSDSGATPYGKLPAAALAARLCQVLARLAELGATSAVIACNAASTALARVDAPIPAVGIIDAGVDSALRWRVASRGDRAVGVIGGARTIRSQIYRRRLEAAGVRVIQRVAQPLSALVEAGELSGPGVDAAVAPILRPLRGVGALLLACTHYPALAPRLGAHLPGAALLDPAEALAEQVLASGTVARGSEPPRWLTTGDPEAMRRAARAAFAVDLASVSRVEP